MEESRPSERPFHIFYPQEEDKEGVDGTIALDYPLDEEKNTVQGPRGHLRRSRAQDFSPTARRGELRFILSLFCLHATASNCIADSTGEGASAAAKHARREEHEVLRTCTNHAARIRVWPAAALPKTPLRPRPLQPPSSPTPPPHLNLPQDTNTPIPSGYTANNADTSPRYPECKEEQQSPSETRPSVAHERTEGM